MNRLYSMVDDMADTGADQYTFHLEATDWNYEKTLSIIAVVKINCYKKNYHHNNYYMYFNS